MVKTSFKILVEVAAVVSIVWPAAQAADEPQSGGTLVAALTSNVRNLNPAVQSGYRNWLSRHPAIRGAAALR